MRTSTAAPGRTRQDPARAASVRLTVFPGFRAVRTVPSYPSRRHRGQNVVLETGLALDNEGILDDRTASATRFAWQPNCRFDIHSLLRFTFNVLRYILLVVIKSFRSSETECLFRRKRVRRLAAIERIAQRKLTMLHTAKELRDLSAVPGNRLEKLQGDRQEQYSIRINDQWRVCFVWRDGDAYDVEITDH
jgi:proteic killer suppression protein